MITLEGVTLYSIDEVADKFSATPRTIRQYIRQGKLKGNRIDDVWYISASAIREYFDAVQAPKTAKQ